MKTNGQKFLVNYFFTGEFSLKLLLIIVITACSNSVDPGSEKPTSSSFVIEVERISVPDTTVNFEALHIWFEGIAGPNDCYRFSYFRDELSRRSLRIQLVGTKFESASCRQEPVTFRELYEVYPPFEESFEVIVQQPDSSFLKDTVYFRGPS